MGTWTSTAVYEGDPKQIIDLLTDIEAIESWSPVPFRIADGPGRLRSGDEISVEGALLGRSLSFHIDVDQANQDGLSLRARGAFEIDVDYTIDPSAARVSARVETRAGKPWGRVLASAASALLSAGTLDRCLRRIVAEATLATASLAA
jgi:hypothetical protein